MKASANNRQNYCITRPAAVKTLRDEFLLPSETGRFFYCLDGLIFSSKLNCISPSENKGQISKKHILYHNITWKLEKHIFVR